MSMSLYSSSAIGNLETSSLPPSLSLPPANAACRPEEPRSPPAPPLPPASADYRPDEPQSPPAPPPRRSGEISDGSFEIDRKNYSPHPHLNIYIYISHCVMTIMPFIIPLHTSHLEQTPLSAPSIRSTGRLLFGLYKQKAFVQPYSNKRPLFDLNGPNTKAKKSSGVKARGASRGKSVPGWPGRGVGAGRPKWSEPKGRPRPKGDGGQREQEEPGLGEGSRCPEGRSSRGQGGESMPGGRSGRSWGPRGDKDQGGKRSRG